MFDGNRILAHDDLLDQKFHDLLTLTYIEGLRIRTQAIQKGRECLCEP